MRQKLIVPLTDEELALLEKVGRRHPFGDFRFRARGLIALHAQLKPGLIAQVLGVSEKSVYNWARWWREDGYNGLFKGHKGGRPAILTAELMASAIEIAAGDGLTLAGIKRRLMERHPQAPDFSLDRLAVRLREHRTRVKRGRPAFKKKAANKTA